jgi:TolB-like protein/Flp pilus assembly protein TadD
MERRLAAIVAADMVGFSRQMGADEVGTLERLTFTIDKFVTPEIGRHGGRIFKSTGDGFLAEFPSAVDALTCAVSVQRATVIANAERDDDERVIFRMGLNIGDVILRDGDVFGDGVNIAARLEPVAPAGGIVVSDTVHAQVRGKTELGFAPLGALTLKNIAEPVTAYRVDADVAEGADAEDQAAGPTNPVLAILPFANLSNDPDQEHLADGIAEDLITTLSQIGTLSLVSRNSAFAFKGQSVSARQIGQALKATHVLSGSVRRGGARIRITAQLSDTASDAQVWAGRFDRGLEDIFAVQDEITLTLATALQVELTEGEQAKLRYTTTDNVTAWMAFIRGLSLFRTVSADTYRQARALFEEALAADPDSAQIRAMLACTHAIEGRFFWTADREHTLDEAKRHADAALAINPDIPDAWAALGYWHMCYRRLDDSSAAYARAVELAPDHADLRALFALSLTFAERANEAVRQAETAMRLNPLDPGWYLGVAGHAYRYAGQLDKAIAVLADYDRRSPGFGLVDLVLAHMDAGDAESARKRAAALLAARPDFTIARWERTQNCKDLDRLARDRQSLTDAGLPLGDGP